MAVVGTQNCANVLSNKNDKTKAALKCLLGVMKMFRVQGLEIT